MIMYNEAKVNYIKRGKHMGKTCFFIGHRNTKSEIAPKLAEEVERHIVELGIETFVVGYYGQFDSMAADTVVRAKDHHPEITLMLLLPYHPTVRPIKTPKGHDGTYYPPGMETVPPKLAIVKANEHMVQYSDYLIAYVAHPSQGSRELLEYALNRQKRGLIRVTNLSGWYPEI